MFGVKHLVKCSCVLQHFKSKKDAPQHQFVVFSVFHDDETIVPKIVQCNNCGILHKVVGLCQTERLDGKEESRAIVTIDDLVSSLPDKLVQILKQYEVDLPTWEHAKFIIENEKWGEYIVLSREEIDDSIVGKYVKIMSPTLFVVEQFSRKVYV